MALSDENHLATNCVRNLIEDVCCPTSSIAIVFSDVVIVVFWYFCLCMNVVVILHNLVFSISAAIWHDKIIVFKPLDDICVWHHLVNDFDTRVQVTAHVP